MTPMTRDRDAPAWLYAARQKRWHKTSAARFRFANKTRAVSNESSPAAAAIVRIAFLLVASSSETLPPPSSAESPLRTCARGMTMSRRNAVPAAPSIPSAVDGEGSLLRRATSLGEAPAPFRAVPSVSVTTHTSSSATAALVSKVSVSVCAICERNRHATPTAARARPEASASKISTDSATSAAPDNDSETPSLCSGFSSRRSATATTAAKTSWKCLRLKNALRGRRKMAWLMSAVARTSANAAGASRGKRDATRETKPNPFALLLPAPLARRSASAASPSVRSKSDKNASVSSASVSFARSGAARELPPSEAAGRFGWSWLARLASRERRASRDASTRARSRRRFRRLASRLNACHSCGSAQRDMATKDTRVMNRGLWKGASCVRISYASLDARLVMTPRGKSAAPPTRLTLRRDTRSSRDSRSSRAVGA
mmetsp:Transcript_3879/g.16492  ORF Transcript_3879/g.16492 Transcript_3879/m.16492 type:complete len:431 (-) Transcript_3879:30-1322(-)